jgi:xylulokinase
MSYLLGFDIGSSSVKASLLDASTGKCVANTFSPAVEMLIKALHPGWAEQEPDQWWQEVINATLLLHQKISFKDKAILAIGISYQMHGLVCIDKNQNVLRPAIIWCDSRAVETGNRAFAEMGETYCLEHLLNSPGNFTASKLRWVKENEPDIFAKIHRILLPGDYIAMRLTGDAVTTVSGLSEGVFWDFKENNVSRKLLAQYEIPGNMLAPVVPTFGEQGKLSKAAAEILGLSAGIPVTYRAGDQPNNAYSLKVLHPGEVAATAGTSAVIYAINDAPVFDQQSRVNAFVHVNHTNQQPRYGILLCVNGAGILNSWLRKNIGADDYNVMNQMAASVSPGTDGLQFFPFGNGAERVLANQAPGAQLQGLNFNIHRQSHMVRAAQEGIAFALKYGFDIMHDMQVNAQTVRAGYANMFLSPVFREIFANTTNTTIELYNTDGAQGAARAAGVGTGHFKNYEESYIGMEKLEQIIPEKHLQQQYAEIYDSWKTALEKILK